MATSIIINATTVAELRSILEEMCGAAPTVTPVKAPAPAPDTSAADAAAEKKAKADAEAKAAAEKKAKAEKLAKLKAEQAALEAEANAPDAMVSEVTTTELTPAIARAKVAELKATTRPTIIAEISAMKKTKGWPSMDDMNQAQLAELMAFMGA